MGDLRLASTGCDKMMGAVCHYQQHSVQDEHAAREKQVVVWGRGEGVLEGGTAFTAC